MGHNFYKRDSRDLMFVLHEFLGIEKLLSYRSFSDFTLEDFDMVLSQADRIAADAIAPTFQDGDRQECRFEDGRVFAPASFHAAWKVFQEGGWFALSVSPQYGGQGLPIIISEAAQEFFMSANFAFGCYSGMGPGNGALIEKYGNQHLKDLFLRKMYDGTWGGSMCLTEPSVGSDAHMVSTKAVPDGEYYRIHGTKTFITSGEHDLTENIIHLVIARIEGAPLGAKGVSLFAVPKIWVNDDGSLGEPNDVACIGIEHKIGMKGSSTCTLNFGENGLCRGYLVGEPGMGLAYMFDMVNLARMAVGLESVAFATNIYANVLQYAQERVQGDMWGQRGKRVRIVEHADVRRMLMNIKAVTEGMRALVYKSYFMEDISKASEDENERVFAKGRLDLLTPVVKAYCADRIFEIGREGIQILGGYGYTNEYPVEQYLRDSKIFSIWDGTNFIQSADLAGRKLNMAGGAVFEGWVNEIQSFIAKNRDSESFAREMGILDEALHELTEIVRAYKRYPIDGKAFLVPLTSTRFLESMAEVAISHLLLQEGLIAQTRLTDGSIEDSDRNFYRSKVETVRYYCRNFLPQVFARARIIGMEDPTAAQISEECLQMF
jgi:3-(methylthio)propanoyl-CoA dehydrogenase